MLQMRPGCECCDRDLPADSGDARICSFECTFCRDCAQGRLAGICPNCGGALHTRPPRPAAKLGQYPASATRVFKPGGCAAAPVQNQPEATSVGAYAIYTPTAEEVHSGELGRRMRQFNYRFVGEYGPVQPVWLSARDATGALVGGLRGFVFLHWLNVELLFVDEAARRQGLGRSLLAAAEHKALALGARHATLNTFEWQARDFYLQQGYQEFGRIGDYVQGFYAAYLHKALQP